MIETHYFSMRRNPEALLRRRKTGREENSTLPAYGSPEHVIKGLEETNCGDPRRNSTLEHCH